MRISKINLNQNFLKNRYSAQTHNRNQHVKNNNISFLSNIRSCKYPWSPYPAEMEKSISFDKAEKLILEGKNGQNKPSNRLEKILFPDDLVSKIDEIYTPVPYVLGGFHDEIVARFTKSSDGFNFVEFKDNNFGWYDHYGYGDMSLCKGHLHEKGFNRLLTKYFESDRKTMRGIETYLDGSIICKKFDEDGHYHYIVSRRWPEFNFYRHEHMEIIYDEDGNFKNIYQIVKLNKYGETAHLHLSADGNIVDADSISPKYSKSTWYKNEAGDITGVEFILDNCRYSADFDYIKGLSNIKKVSDKTNSD